MRRCLGDSVLGRNAALGLATLVASAAVAPMAHAQQRISQDKADRSATQVGELVVTAERRETLLQDTPAAITAITAAQIERSRMVNLSDVQLSVPSLTYVQITHQEAYLSIRGTSVKQSAPGTDLGVSVFIDDVPTTGIGDNDPNLFDLQSIEVLRGPQGTLFGRNVTGGVVLVRTSPPSFTPEFKGQLTYGSDNLMEARALVTGPILSDTLAGKLTLDVRRRDGNVTDVTLQTKINDENIGSLRGQLLWTPSTDLRVLFSGDYSRDTSQGRATALLADFVPSLFPTVQFGPGVTNDPFPPRSAKTAAGASIKVDWTTLVGTLTSITGYRYIDESILYNAIGDPAGQFHSTQIIRDNQLSEEVHLASPTEGRRFTWIGGLFFLHSQRAAPHHFDINVLPGTVLSFVDPYSKLVFSADQNQAVSTTSEAAFGEATYAVTSTLRLTVGGRYSYEHKSGHSEVFDTSGLSPNLAAVYAHSWSAFTPKATLTFEPSRHLLTYATVASGFQSGGYDISASTVAGLEKPFSPEKVVSYEVGAKANGLDGRLQLNLAAFRADYQDLQRTVFDAKVVSQITTNAGRARVQGVEFEGTFIPVSWLTLGAAYTYTDAKYTDYVDRNNPDGPIVYTGNTLPTVARNQLHASAEINAPWPTVHGDISAGADVTYRSKTHFDDANDEPAYILDRTPFKGLLNMHLAWKSSDAAVEVMLWGKNLTDQRSLVDANGFTAFFATFPELRRGVSLFHGFFTEGRSVGITLTARR